ncbi:hypothetical protein [Pseudoalteromonas sp. HF66]|uniref:hypothetical protein n=1 Tax=Pseudoalteromonas sp. HF66 TaxID=2721559 RepID=UPI0014318D1C|nr:hypothetical protein [Pseudoalteromonas sp. HF66]NIZ06420.1 hypothetical protein [Pseudoalteromonas sp. HF66]
MLDNKLYRKKAYEFYLKGDAGANTITEKRFPYIKLAILFFSSMSFGFFVLLKELKYPVEVDFHCESKFLSFNVEGSVEGSVVYIKNGNERLYLNLRDNRNFKKNNEVEYYYPLPEKLGSCESSRGIKLYSYNNLGAIL